MNLNEDEKRMVYQIESTNQVAALNEIYMTWCYAPNQAMKNTAESLLRKLRPLSDKECMDVIREVQQNYRLPGKARTIGEMMAEARQQSGAQKLAGHDIMALERFNPDTLFSHSYFRLAASAHGMSASELLSSRLMFPTPLASDNNTGRDARNLDVFLSDNGIFRKRNKNGAIWSLPLSAAVFYLTPVASDGFRSTLKPSAFDPKKKDGNLSAQMIALEQPVSDTAALNPDWVEWLMGFPKGWTDVFSGQGNPMESPA